MATTTLLQRHAGEGETIAETIRDCLNYGKDPEKTESGKYILSLIHILVFCRGQALDAYY